MEPVVFVAVRLSWVAWHCIDPEVADTIKVTLGEIEFHILRA